MFPQNSYVEIQTQNVMVLGSDTLGAWLGHEGGALLSGINALTKEAPESPLSHSSMTGY